MSTREPAVIVSAADDRYAMPLAVSLRSASENLAEPRCLDIHVIDGGVAPANREKVERSLDPRRARLQWIEPPAGAVENLMISGHISAATYLKLLIPDLLPGNVRKAIYLDCDLVVKADLGGLWEQEIGGHHLLAVQDMSEPTVSSPRALRNYRELGLAPDLKYFNAGVLVLDLDRWRKERVGESVLRYLKENAEHVRWHEQDGLNAVLAGKWGELDPRWNQAAHIHNYDSWKESPFERDVYEALITDPYIVHFVTSSKPWHFGCAHPERDLFFHYLDRTAWAGWRPRKTLRDSALGRTWSRVRRGVRRVAIG